ncbi:B3 domain-containing protein Os01g0234100-like isoform X2 [Andrographis paniculata]|uniref:B3 domain-containing protein Os01g0234100-like isoform X2 n=1 Tax=Andrographis paniculata TaxID=175694 RepID=UPI0021E91211|nr:B3 domain-containing protein Os01g0234100-like isoform X2 [Andrographis paniculata]
MKLRIVHQSQDYCGGEERPVKKEEEVEVQPTPEPPSRDLPENEPVEENSAPLEAAPVSYFDPMLVSGKRRRKPKEMFDEISPVVIRRKTKPAGTSKSKDGMPDSRGAWTGKVDAGFGGSSTSEQSKSPTMIRAEEVLSSLGNERPAILKLLVRSHVGSCFWMGLPVPFCKMHLPSRDAIVFLENENGEEFPIKYIAHKTGLSAGWRRFVAGNKLLEGDVLIFQLTEPCRFKVYIIRANDLTEVDGALSLLILDSQTKQIDAEGGGNMDRQSKKKRRPKSLPLMVVQEKKQLEDDELGHEFPLPEEHSGNDSDEVASEVLEGTKFSGSSSQFSDVRSYEEFHIVVNGICIDSELPEDAHRKYYELCSSQNAFLHSRLLPGLHSKLAASILVETINIGDAIRCSTLTTPRKDFEVWEKSLRSFELLGLNVGFLRARLSRLLSLAHDSNSAAQARRYWEAQKELDRTEHEVQKVEAKLIELKEISAAFRRDVDNLKSKAEMYEAKFQEEADAPW